MHRWARIWELCRPIQSWVCEVENNLVQGHKGGVDKVHDQPLDRRILDRKIPAEDKPGVPERSKILEHVQKFLNMGIIKEGIPHKSVIDFCPEYDDIVKILGKDIHKDIKPIDRPSMGSLRFWVVRKLSETMSLGQIRRKLKTIYIPDVQVWWDTFIMCHPVYCVEARGAACERLTLLSDLDTKVLWTMRAAECLMARAELDATGTTRRGVRKRIACAHTGCAT